VTHPTEGELSLFAIARDFADTAESTEAHLINCAECRAALEVHRQFDSSLREAEPWLVANPAADAHRSSLREMALRMKGEDEQADILLAPLLASPYDGPLWEALVNEQDFRTGGVVRRLCETAHEVCARVPSEALKLSRAAIAISTTLSDDFYPARAVSALRGVAWKELANASRYLDQFDEALEALAQADKSYRELASPELDLAIVDAIRAFVLMETQDLDGAEKCGKRALDTFRHLGQDSRSLYTLTNQAFIHRYRGEFELAIEINGRVLTLAEEAYDPTWKAVAKTNLAWCYLESGKLPEASRLFRAAKAGCTELGFVSDVTRCDWGLALVSRDLGNHREALGELLIVSRAFAEQQIVADSATAMVDAFEVMLALDEPAEIEQLATGLVATLTEAHQMENALTALAYIKEAAARKSVTPEILSAAHTFLRRVDRHPNLTFAPPHPS
jgi:tetratricopeptide (TPR) repeat protein